MESELTYRANKVICALYKDYKKKLKSGKSSNTAMLIGDLSAFQKRAFPKWVFPDFKNACQELRQADLLHYLNADNIIYRASLTTAGIAYAENRPKNRLKEIAEILWSFFSFGSIFFR